MIKFAYSSGLESASSHDHGINVVQFLAHSLGSVACTSLPFLRAAYNSPESSVELDDTFDANTPCQVARRASVNQGRALLKLVDKTFLQHCDNDDEHVYNAIKNYQASLHGPGIRASGHFAVVFGLAGRVLRIDLERLAFIFLQSHSKAVLSAAVRLSLIGPYESTHDLASKATQAAIRDGVTQSEQILVEDCGQTFSLIDIWQGRHEALYSRIFSA